jgi:hypothetical protein
MKAKNESFCIHCDRRARVGELGLCPRCDANKGIRRLYVRRRGWTPAWEEHLRRLARRAQARLPLFDDVPAPRARSG